jgi:gpW
MRRRGGILSGVDRATLQQWLDQALLAHNQLRSGAKVVSAAYAQGDGNKQVTYTAASLHDLIEYIGDLREALGIVRRSRRPMRFWYR